MAERIESRPAVLFDLDGTLVDSVYQHVLAWRQALAAQDIDLSVWRIHRRIGMSGGLLVNALLRETGRDLGPEDVRRLQSTHAHAFAELLPQVRPLPGAVTLLHRLTQLGIPWAVATSGSRGSAIPALDLLGVVPDVVVTREEVPYAKPDPHLFLAAAHRLGVDIEESIVVGDSAWDMLAAQRARALGVGVLSGGYGREELERAGAFRVYEDTADLDWHLDELGIRPPPGPGTVGQ
ncbi:MAG TPA: HAD family hydrolase [Candidatus Dormibacteraeota bacterium]|jgi:HAD superfamily hydrolase (TIGR01509 family)